MGAAEGAGKVAAMSPAEDYARYRTALTGRSLPAAFVDLDRFDANAHAVLERTGGGKPVRVASKSVRSQALLRRVQGLDVRFRGLLCFTAAEALHLAERGFDDLLVAYPTVEPALIRAVADAAAGGATLTLMVDSVDHVDHLEAVLAGRDTRLPVCLDLDLSWDLPGLRFGVYRSPTTTVDQAVTVARRITGSRVLRLEGIMGYEAQVAGVAERAPGRSRAEQAAIVALKRRSLRRIARRRAEVVAAVEEVAGPLRFVNGGGTGSLESTSAERAVTEVTAGSALFAPGLFDHYDGFRHLPAAGFALPVVRRPAPEIMTCLGGGYIASGAAGPDKVPVPWLPAGGRLLPNEGAGEVQTPVRFPAEVAAGLQLGDPVFFRHAKAGELCERFDRLLCVSDGKVVDEVTTYRGEGKTFL